MLRWAVAFLVIALIAAALGFGALAGVANEFARVIFFVAIALFVITAIIGLIQNQTSRSS